MDTVWLRTAPFTSMNCGTLAGGSNLLLIGFYA